MRTINFYRSLNYTGCICLLLVSCLMLGSCTGENRKETENGNDSIANIQNLRVLTDEHMITTADVISIDSAAIFTANWRTINQIKSCSDEAPQKSGYFLKRDDLLQLGEFMGTNGKGIRLYFGKESNNDTIRLIMASVLSSGRTLVSQNGMSALYDFSTPCPSICDKNSVLQGGECLTPRYAEIKHTLIKIDSVKGIDLAKNWRTLHEIPDDCGASGSTKVKYYWISKEVINDLLGNGSNANRSIRVYFGSPSTDSLSPIYLILVPAIYDPVKKYTEDIDTLSIYIARKVCPNDNCNCLSSMDRD